MVHLDGFHLSHVIEPLELPDETKVTRFIGINSYPLPLHPDKPVAMGDFGPPFIYTEAKWAQEVGLRNSKETILKVWGEFDSAFGREYKPVEQYQCEDAEVLLLTMGSFGETAMTAIDEMRNKGQKVGLVKLRLWRPFPFKELRQVVKEAQTLIVLDRSLSFGGPGGPVASEIKSALYDQPQYPKVVSFIGGLGGRDITVHDFEKIVKRGVEVANNGSDTEFEMYGVRQ
jgi:pyruvate ferredoxin oxidoreductase alpha subunit